MIAFVIIPVLLVCVLVWGVRATSGRRTANVIAFITGAWMAATWRAASSGLLRQFGATPPPFAILVAGIVVLACALAFSGAGRGAPGAQPSGTAA